MDPLFQVIDLPLDLGERFFIGCFLGQIEQDLAILDLPVKRSPPLDLAGQKGALL